MQYCERVTGAATWHQIPLLEQNPAAESCAGDESGVGLRTVRVNDGGSAARPGPSALPLSLQCPPVPPVLLPVIWVSLGFCTLCQERQFIYFYRKHCYSPDIVRGVRSL